ncbi:glycosyltransferase family 39 protein [Paludibaculum fermentans]|uniref:glycosyltransferase family 39 protein n=1 Tax=Paludibaculum fermentans TaxID=1473598 RepID=UPI003EC036BD
MKSLLPVVSLFRPWPVVLVVLAYCVLLAALMAQTPLWLDEVLQLLGTSSADPARAVSWSAQNAGGVPLGYLVQWAFIHALGQSPLIARLPSALAGLLSVFVLLRICRAIALPRPSIALILFMILPLQLRYAVEARPYSLALLFTLLATEAVLRLRRDPRILYFVIYLSAATAALYTQPYSGFLLAAHVCWLMRENRALALKLSATLAVSLAAFAPWYLYAHNFWAEAVESSGVQFRCEPATLLMAVREISGGGYAVSIPLIILAVCGVVRGNLEAEHKRLLAAAVLVPPVCVLAADAWFGYFFAIRQLIFILPALVILAAEGSRLLIVQHRQLGTIALTLLLLAATAGNFRHIRTKGENWALAASVLKLATDSRACALVAPRAHLALYSHFQPGLASRTCLADLTRQPVVIAATSPYTTPSEARRLWQQLSDAGFESSYHTRAGGTNIYVLRRQTPGTLTRWPNDLGPLAANPGPLTVPLRTFAARSPILTSEANHVSQIIAVPRPLPRPHHAPCCSTVDGQRRYDSWNSPGSFPAGGTGRQSRDFQPDHGL